MTLEDQITALLAEAEPLRCLPDEEAEAQGLPALVDRINALRAHQAALPAVAAEARTEVETQMVDQVMLVSAPVVRRGRPRKVSA